MLTEVSVARVSCRVWDASTDQTEEKVPAVPAESARLPGVRHSFAPILSFPQQEGVVLGAGSGP